MLCRFIDSFRIEPQQTRKNTITQFLDGKNFVMFLSSFFNLGFLYIRKIFGMMVNGMKQQN